MPRSRTLLAVACLAIGFLAATAVRVRPADPEARLPDRYRLAALIQREQRSTEALQQQVATLRAQVDDLRREAAGRQEGASTRERELREIARVAGLEPLEGAGVKVVLDDSEREESPSGNVNDLVIHSQDVQGVVNALWKAGAEAIAINGQRVVTTSAVLCVGNTLLLNGTVHSPPYAISAIGAIRDRFEADRLVRRLHDDARSFGLRFSVTREHDLQLPAFEGVTTMRFARPRA